jgi:hypothetical protein
MIIVERAIGGVIRCRKVFLPNDAQLAELVGDLRPFDLLRVFRPGACLLPYCIHPAFQIRGTTTFIDLSKGLAAISAGMHASCRYKVRRAEKMRDRFEIVTNTDGVLREFLPFYNNFARKARHIPLLTTRQLNELQPHSDIFMLYFEGRPTCGRLVLRDEETRTALMVYSGTRRLDEDADTITIGLLNRYLYWHEMKTYQAAGLNKYDFAGVSDGHPSLASFKLSFGGALSTFNYCFYAGTGRSVWKILHYLYEFQQMRRFHSRRGVQLAPP